MRVEAVSAPMTSAVRTAVTLGCSYATLTGAAFAIRLLRLGMGESASEGRTTTIHTATIERLRLAKRLTQRSRMVTCGVIAGLAASSTLVRAQDADVATTMLEDGLCRQQVPPVVRYAITQCLVLGSMYSSDPVPAEGPILGYRSADAMWIVLTKDRGPVAVVACFGPVVGSTGPKTPRPLVAMPCKQLSAAFCANARDAARAGVTGLESLLHDCEAGAIGLDQKAALEPVRLSNVDDLGSARAGGHFDLRHTSLRL
jgi:hypothetical protein